MNAAIARERAALPAGSPLARQTLLWLAADILLWVALPLAVSVAPGDNYEQLDWAQHPALGYDKHPPLPTLALWALGRVFPSGVPLTYALGALQVIAMLCIAWRILRDTLGDAAAWRGTVLITCATYYSMRLHFHNHNMTVLVCYAGAMLYTWRAAQGGRLTAWIALGLCWGAGMLSKYQMAVGIAANLWYLWRYAGISRGQLIRGVLVAGGTSVLVFSPHVYWLVENNFPTFRYASRALGADHPWLDRPFEVLRFYGEQLWRLAPVAAVAWFARRQRPAPSASPPAVAATVRQLFAVHAFVPFLLMGLLALVAGAELVPAWGTSFLWIVPLWYLATTAGQWLRQPAAPGFLRTAILVQAVVMLWFFAWKGGGLLLAESFLDL